MSTFNNAIEGIKHINDPLVMAELQRIKRSYYLSRNISIETKLTDIQRKELATLWADYIIIVGGKYNVNTTVRD